MKGDSLKGAKALYEKAHKLDHPWAKLRLDWLLGNSLLAKLPKTRILAL